MANNIKTVMTYPLNGSTRDFNIPFEYLARKFIQVTLIGRDRKPLSNIDDYRFTSKNQITTNKAWGSGDGYELIELRRFTSATERLVDFSDGSILRAYDLNVSQIQTLHVAEEARDLTADTIGVNNEGHLDARGRRIVNLADPVNELDAVNLKTIKEWNNGAYQSFIKAQEEANKAARSAEAAKVSETNAYNHMTQAGVSEQQAKVSETAANTSKNAAAASAQTAAQSASSASNSAQEATSAKDYTKQQADRSYSEAERAKGYADSMGNTIDIGKVISTIDTQANSVVWKGDHSFKNIAIGDEGSIRSSDTNIVMSHSKSRYSFTIDSSNTSGWWDLRSNQFRVYLDNSGTLSALGGFVVRNPTGYSGIKMVGTGGWSTTLETNGGSREAKVVTSDASGAKLYDLSFPQEESGVLATRQWTRREFAALKPFPSWIWGGDFSLNNKKITLTNSIIGKKIIVQTQSNWATKQVLHIINEGNWCTSCAGDYNIFYVSPDGKALECLAVGGAGGWKNLWIID